MIRPLTHDDRGTIGSGDDSLSVERCLEIHRLMVRARAMELRMIKMSKSGEGYFWIGGPGEEAFNVCLGLQVNLGEGPDYDYLHLHYRNSATMLAMGMPMIDGIRQMAMTRTDPNSMGRNFVGHYARREWNVVPVTSVVEVQYAIAPGTALVQKRHGGDGITIVVGGDAGTAEGDFASCMIWSSRPGEELPVLMVVTNNAYGISTPYESQHAERHIADRGKPLGIVADTIDGNDPIVAWHGIAKAMEHCRRERQPYLLEAMVSRLHGHSSSSGANRVEDEVDCIERFERVLLKAGAIDEADLKNVHDKARAEVENAIAEAMKEEQPTAADVPRFTYAPSEVDAVYPHDYTGLPACEEQP
ncbi:MAG: thiamine pyrophosphate-dependent dehydrogenase E1 component subunit alpha [Phycisphaeraceae bacterium]